LIEFCFIVSLILLIFSPWAKYTSLGVRLSNDSWNSKRMVLWICTRIVKARNLSSTNVCNNVLGRWATEDNDAHCFL